MSKPRPQYFHRYLLLIVWLFSGCQEHDQLIAGDADPGISAQLQALVDGRSIPGAAVIMAVDGKVKSRTFVGYRDTASRAPVSGNSIFRLYSMTKPIVTVAAMTMVEDGLLGLDDPIAKWLPEFAEVRVVASDDNSKRTLALDRPITVRHLMNHSSGLTYHHTGNGAVSEHYRRHGIFTLTPVGQSARDSAPAASLSELIERLADAPLAHQPGEQFTYGQSTAVLGAVLEVVSGQGLDTLVERRVLAPLEMHDTRFVLEPGDIDRLATNYRLDETGLVPVAATLEPDYTDDARALDGGSGLLGTADDYMRFALMLANSGTLEGRKLLSKASVEALFNAELTYPWDSRSNRFALGFQIGDAASDKDGQLPSGAAGWAGSANTFFWVHPQHRTAAVFMTQVIMAPERYKTVGRHLRSIVSAASNGTTASPGSE